MEFEIAIVALAVLIAIVVIIKFWRFLLLMVIVAAAITGYVNRDRLGSVLEDLPVPQWLRELIPGSGNTLVVQINRRGCAPIISVSIRAGGEVVTYFGDENRDIEWFPNEPRCVMRWSFADLPDSEMYVLQIVDQHGPQDPDYLSRQNLDRYGWVYSITEM